MAQWSDVDRLASRLPDARRGQAHEGSPAWYGGRHQFARLRFDDDGRELVQVWTGEMDTAAALASRRDVFAVIHTFKVRVTMWAYLDRLDLPELAELVLDSYGIRAGPTRLAAIDRAAYFEP